MAEKTPLAEFRDGRVGLPDLPIAAGLLSLNGAAYDEAGRWYYPGDDTAAWLACVKRPGITEIATRLAGVTVERRPVTLRSDWIDHTEAGGGRHYRAGESVQMPRGVFWVEGAYITRQMATRRVPWREADCRDWLLRWHRPGSVFLVVPAVFDDWVNKLRNELRDKGITHRWQMPKLGGTNG